MLLEVLGEEQHDGPESLGKDLLVRTCFCQTTARGSTAELQGELNANATTLHKASNNRGRIAKGWQTVQTGNSRCCQPQTNNHACRHNFATGCAASNNVSMRRITAPRPPTFANIRARRPGLTSAPKSISSCDTSSGRISNLVPRNLACGVQGCNLRGCQESEGQ